MKSKTFQELREEQQQLNELRLLRSGAALFYASKVKQEGNKLEQDVRNAHSEFSSAKQRQELSAKIDKMIDGLDSLGRAMIRSRFMMGSMTGISVVAALLAERSDKQLKLLLKGNKRR